MKQRHINMIAICLILLSTPAYAQYEAYDPYAPKGSSVEVNLDVLTPQTPQNRFNPNQYERLQLKKPDTPTRTPSVYQSNQTVLTPPPSQPFDDMKDDIQAINAPELQPTETTLNQGFVLKPSGPKPDTEQNVLDRAIGEHSDTDSIVAKPVLAKPTSPAPETSQPTKISKPVVSHNPRQELPRTAPIRTRNVVEKEPVVKPETTVAKTSTPIAKPVAEPILTKPTKTQEDVKTIISEQQPVTPQKQPVVKPEIKAEEVTPAPAIPITDESFDNAIAEVEAEKENKTTNMATRAVPSLSDLTVSFDGNSSELTEAAKQKLAGVITQLEELTETRLQVRAFATGEGGNKTSARRISLSRALTVRSYLMDQGIKPTRVDVRALGTETDRSPLDRVDLLFAR